MLTEEKVREDVAHLLSHEQVVLYVVSRVKEFENLRKIYEKDIATFKAIANQAGENADNFIRNELTKHLFVRNSWWIIALEKASGVRANLGNGNEVGRIEEAVEEFMSVVLENVDKVKEFRANRTAIDVEKEGMKQLGDGQ